MTKFYDGYAPSIPIFRFALNEGLSDLYLPTRGSERATGWDVRSSEKVLITPGSYVKIPLGFRMFCPEGWWMELRPRSSSFVKKHLHALYGVIDEDYEGQCVFACQYQTDDLKELVIEIGEAIGQMVPIKRQDMIIERVSHEEYEELCKERNTSRGSGGFGSTSK